MNNEPRSAAEWRADPLGIANFRWWDGTAWTGYTSDSDAGAPDAGARQNVQREVHVPAAAAATPSYLTPEPARPAPQAVAPARPAAGQSAAGQPSATPTRGPWPASLPQTPAPRAATLEEAAAGVGGSSDWLREDVDWSRLVIRLKTAIDAIEDDLLEVQAGDLPPLVIDIAQHAYWWDLPLAEMPARVSSISISTLDRLSDGMREPGRNLDPMLWSFSRVAFEGENAPWMRVGDRYRLHRWPNLTTLPHEPHHLRAISLLGQASLTSSEFATVAELDPREAQQLLTTFSLMGLLRVTPAQEAPRPAFVAAAPQKKQSGGLFGRLSKLFGR